MQFVLFVAKLVTRQDFSPAVRGEDSEEKWTSVF